MSPDSAWELLVSRPVAVLATVDPDGSPHLVPFTFAALPGRRLVSAVDEKPKGSRRLRRVENVRRDPRVTVLAHLSADDWSELWWVRARGIATVTDAPPEGGEEILRRRYPAYATQELGPWAVIEVGEISGWAASADR